tara:strand:- start:195 stop:1070 length:876 start_codon:yes stop_codon:yes gene_type:complete
MALEMSAAEAPDPVPYAEKLGIAPEALEKSTAFIHQKKYLNVPEVEAAFKATSKNAVNGVPGKRITPNIVVRPFDGEKDTDMLLHLDVVTAHEILGDKARIFGRLFFDKHCGINRTSHLEWRTLTATIGDIPLGFVMYFRYKGRGSGAFSVGADGSRKEGGGGGIDDETSDTNGLTSQIKGGYIDLFWILVHPNHRQIGVGSSLIREVSARGRAEWPFCDQVRLYVMDSNVKALSLYRTHGFERTKRRENYPEIGTASYRMVKRFQDGLLKNIEGTSDPEKEDGTRNKNEE